MYRRPRLPNFKSWDLPRSGIHGSLRPAPGARPLPAARSRFFRYRGKPVDLTKNHGHPPLTTGMGNVAFSESVTGDGTRRTMALTYLAIWLKCQLVTIHRLFHGNSGVGWLISTSGHCVQMGLWLHCQAATADT